MGLDVDDKISMSSERFEAFMDAVLAIIITVIVLELPNIDPANLSGFWAIRTEFLAYIISYIIIFNYWNYHQVLFGFVENVDKKSLIINGISMFILTFLPYLTKFVAENFYSLIAQSFYGIEFILIDLVFYLTCDVLKKSDSSNSALQNSFDTKKHAKYVFFTILIGFIIAFLGYPPAIIFFCFISLVVCFVLT